MDLTGQWADTLLAAERLYALKLGAWALLSVAAGTILLTLLRLRATASPLLGHFAVQLLAWGVIEGAVALWLGSRVSLRDLAGAVALDRALWFGVGLDVGLVAVGATLAVGGWVLGRRLAAVGAGLGVIVHGAALLLLHLQLAEQVIRG